MTENFQNIEEKHPSTIQGQQILRRINKRKNTPSQKREKGEKMFKSATDKSILQRNSKIIMTSQQQ